MKYLLIGVFLAFLAKSYAQDSDNTEKFRVVGVQPTFKGGMQGFYKYISKNIIYPEEAIGKGYNGQVLVQFVIDTSGVILDETITIHKSLYEPLDNEALRLIKECPDWIPGRETKNGKTARVRMILPITFIEPKSKKKKRNRPN